MIYASMAFGMACGSRYQMGFYIRNILDQEPDQELKECIEVNPLVPHAIQDQFSRLPSWLLYVMVSHQLLFKWVCHFYLMTIFRTSISHLHNHPNPLFDIITIFTHY